MSTLRCIAVDDEPLALEVIRAHIAQIPHLNLLGSFQNPMEAFAFLKENEVDLMFLDIEMPMITGLDFLKTLAQPPKTIFTTAYREYAIESYELDVLDYLLKPISFQRFFKAVSKFPSTNAHTALPTQLQTPVQDHLYVNVNKKFVKVLFDDILYAESLKDYVRIHTKQQRILTKESLSAFSEKLSSNFLRVHRSYLVNTDKVTAFTKVDVEIGEIEIPIGASYKDVVLQRLQ